MSNKILKNYIESYLATGTVWMKLTLAGLEQHALGHDGGAHSFVAGGH